MLHLKALLFRCIVGPALDGVFPEVGTEEALQFERLKPRSVLRSVLQAHPVLLIGKNPSGRIFQTANKGADDVFGHERNDGAIDARGWRKTVISGYAKGASALRI